MLFNMFIIQPDVFGLEDTMIYLYPMEVRSSAGLLVVAPWRHDFAEDYTESIDAVGRALKVLKAEKKFLGTNNCFLGTDLYIHI